MSSYTINIESFDIEVPRTHSVAIPTHLLWRVVFHLRPYFVIPRSQIPGRILNSLWPPLVFLRFKRVYSDLICPTVIVLLLIGQLSHGLFVSGKYPPEGNAIVSAVLICFTYIFFVPLVVFCLVRVFGTLLTYMQVLSLFGYSLAGHCVTLFLSSQFHEENSNSFFLVCLVIFGGLSTARLALIFIAKTSDPGARLIIGTLVSVANLLFLIYLHFACMCRVCEKV